MYAKFAVKERGFTKKQINEMKKVQKEWGKLFVVLHDEGDVVNLNEGDVVNLNEGYPFGKPLRSRYWAEMSNQPINHYRNWNGKRVLGIGASEEERMDAFIEERTR